MQKNAESSFLIFLCKICCCCAFFFVFIASSPNYFVILLLFLIDFFFFFFFFSASFSIILPTLYSLSRKWRTSIYYHSTSGECFVLNFLAFFYRVHIFLEFLFCKVWTFFQRLLLRYHCIVTRLISSPEYVQDCILLHLHCCSTFTLWNSYYLLLLLLLLLFINDFMFWFSRTET